MPGFAFVACNCAACGAFMQANPVHCPSLSVNGSREPICEACFNRWNHIHRTSKGLEPIPLHPEAYTGCPEEELPL